MGILLCFFFFSSRRRHTRYIGDWSSDVCSSDLVRPQGATVIAIIEGILAVLALLGALVLIGIGGLAGGLVGASGGEGSAAAGGLVAGFGIVGGLIFGLIGVLYLAIAYGVWKARSWSWMLGVVVTIIGLVFAVLGLSGGISISSIISLALPIV